MRFGLREEALHASITSKLVVDGLRALWFILNRRRQSRKRELECKQQQQYYSLKQASKRVVYYQLGTLVWFATQLKLGKLSGGGFHVREFVDILLSSKHIL